MTETRFKALALLGPTASGKTGLALALARYLPIEIISLDSALVYRDMNIGTAKPTAAEQAEVPHHLIDIISPLMNYSAAQFVTDCVEKVQDIHQRGRLPIIVGGTMMYYHALTQGLNSLPAADEATRARLNEQKQRHGLTYLYQQLQQIDPVTANRLAAGDSQRIERALEVFYLTGQTLSEHFARQQAFTPPLNLYSITLMPTDRSRLHHNIRQRFHQMLQQGFIEEVQQLRQHYPTLHPDLPSMRCVGYRQAWDFLEGKTDQPTFIEHSLIATRQLAKRQCTWLRKLSTDTLLDPTTDTHAVTTLHTLAQRFFSQPD
ncbi:tRNA (adenosine(37)-N6)-dimethylallyltransferase MiaA [Neisseriaceae bacterium ESL0693]|nr:tRNA (adenosine(37)-N6)-dimethylallyltransferase MiaA [Neisseriaceae bacterium ESL0693]